MMKFVSKTLGTTFFAGLVTLWTGAASAENFPSFDCYELLRTADFENAGRNADDNIFLHLHKSREIPKGPDPVNVHELLDGGEAPLLARSVDGQSKLKSSDLYLGCNLILLEFHLSSGSGIVEDSLLLKDEFNQTTFFPLLTVGTFNSATEETEKFNNWKKENFSIPVKFNEFGNDKAIEFFPKYLRSIEYFDVSNWSQLNTRIVKLNIEEYESKLPKGIRDFLTNNQMAPSFIFALCGSESCENVDKELENMRDENKKFGDSGSDLGLRFQYVNGVGKVTTVVADRVGGLGCLLQAVSKDVFTEELEECQNNTEYAHLVKQGALFRIKDVNTWQIVAGARYPDPDRIEVFLPNGQGSLECQMDVVYTLKSGDSKRLPLEPDPDGVKFTANFGEAAPARDPTGDGAGNAQAANTIAISLEVNSTESACGGPSRNVKVDASRILTVPLVAHARGGSVVAHIVTTKTNDVKDLLGLDETEQEPFGHAVANAVEAAHVRVAVTNDGRPWSLKAAVFGALKSGTSDDEFQVLAKLDSDDLRHKPKTEFSKMDSNHRSQIAKHSPRFTEETIQSTLKAMIYAPSVLKQFSADGVDRLTITLLAPILTDEGGGLPGPCKDPRFTRLAETLNATSEIEFDVVVFPVVKLEPEHAPDLSAIRPLSQFGAPPTLPSGMYTCLDTPKNVTIYPYYFEPWRDQIEFTPRYASALSDQLALVLEDLITEGN